MIGHLPPEDMTLVLRLLAVLMVGAWLARPLALRLVPGGGGWVAALLLAWAVIGWVPWALAALGLLPFDTGALSGLLALAALRRLPGLPTTLDSKSASAAGAAVMALFWLGLAQRLGFADLTGLEKFTDMGFLAAAMRADTMPPPDAWFAGKTLNYYYVGQAMAASWGHVVGASPDRAYQLAMALLFALTGLGTWRLTALLAAPFSRRIAGVLGLASATLTLYGGNFHSVLYTLLRNWMPTTRPEGFNFPDSTRFIGVDPPTPDNGFTEFPAYAFAVGDLHAHVVATPLFLLGLMIVLSILRRGLRGEIPDLAQAAALGWVIGLFVAINTWDVAILGLVALVAGLILIVQRGSDAARLDRLGQAVVVVLAAAALTAAPFLGHFEAFANSVVPAPAQTPLWQLAVLYGHAVPAILLFAVSLRWLPAQSALPVALVLLSAFLLIALPEAVIVRDIYGQDFARANTMFKLTFRAQTLLIAGGLAALAPAIRRGKGWFAVAFLAAVPIVSTLAYAPHIFKPPATIRSLDGLAFLGPERAMVAFAGGLPLAPGEAFIEASGPSFGETARVSAMTGQPTVIGWAGHEWLWRNDSAAPTARAELVRQFYTTPDATLRCSIVARFNIRYVILAAVERHAYPDLNESDLRRLGPVLFDDAGGAIIGVDRNRCV